MTAPREPLAHSDAIIRREPAALEAVARENVAALLRAARAAGLSDADAYDAVQETLLVFVEKADRYDGRASVRTWLFGILFNKISERRRAAFVLREVEQLDLDEVCNVLAVTRNNLGVLLFRARNALRECLEAKGIEGSGDAAL